MKDYVEVPRRVFKLIKEWQTTDLNHYFYISKKYRNRSMDEHVENLPSEESSPEKIILRRRKGKKIRRFY